MFVPKVHRYIGKFMVLPRDHVNAFVVELENSVVVVDSTLALSNSLELRQLAESFGKPIEAVLLTHGHPDHWGGFVSFADLPRLGSQGAEDFAREEDRVKSPTATMYLGEDWPAEHIFLTDIIKDGFSTTFGGVTFTFTDLGPGESPSDGMWSFQADGIKHVFTGDSVAYQCHCFFRDGHALEWLKLLDRLERDLDFSKTKMWFGHGEVPGGKNVIDWQRGYINSFVDSVKRIGDRTLPVPRSIQEQVLADMQTYLPGEATLFLLDYEMDITLQNYYKQFAERGLI